MPDDTNRTVFETGNRERVAAVLPVMTVAITKSQRRGIVGAAVLLLIVVVVAVTTLGGRDDVQDAGSPVGATDVDSELPQQGFDLFDGATATFADFEGAPLVVNFWASWCPACVGELPDFQAVHERRDDVTFLGIANADIRPAAVRLADDVGLTYTLADDPKGDLFRQFGLIAMPSTVFVSPDGQILEVVAGQLDESALDDRLDRLVASS